jgi:hypothetical protein
MIKLQASIFVAVLFSPEYPTDPKLNPHPFPTKPICGLGFFIYRNIIRPALDPPEAYARPCPTHIGPHRAVTRATATV